jgi:hypothetical protein
MAVGNTDATMTDYLPLDRPGSVAFGIGEMPMQFATSYVTLLPSVPAGHGKNRVAGKVDHGERRAPWQQIHYDECVRLEKSRQN